MKDLEALNAARGLLNGLVTKPSADSRDAFLNSVISIIEGRDVNEGNDWLPFPFWDPYSGDLDSKGQKVGGKVDSGKTKAGGCHQVRLLWPSAGSYQLFECAEVGLHPDGSSVLAGTSGSADAYKEVSVKREVVTEYSADGRTATVRS